MTRKTGWQGSTSGPDWVDVEALMRAIGAIHSAHVAYMVSPAGSGFGSGVTVEVRSTFELLPGSSLPAEVLVKKDWPCDQHATLSGHVFALLHQLDFKISQVYKNESLWE